MKTIEYDYWGYNDSYEENYCSTQFCTIFVHINLPIFITSDVKRWSFLSSCSATLTAPRFEVTASLRGKKVKKNILLKVG